MRSRRRRNRALRWLYELNPERREQAIVSHLATAFEQVETRNRSGGWIEVLGRDAGGGRFVVRCCARWIRLKPIDVQITAALRDAQRAQGAAILGLGSVALGTELAARQTGVAILDRDRLAERIWASQRGMLDKRTTGA